MMRSIWIGFDPREANAFAVARYSARRLLTQPIPIQGVVLSWLQARGLYTRPIETRRGCPPVMWDTISDAPMSTEFACSRFLVPHLAQRGLALFVDCDVLVRYNLARLFEIAEKDRSKAVWCVKHKHEPPPGLKMDGQMQTLYARKNWSSVMLFNLEHEANKRLTLDAVNGLPGRDLHRFCWLEDHEIGELGPEWNFLVGHTNADVFPFIVHFTDGHPGMTGYERVPYADEWRETLAEWAT